jgi:hypothetical protein
MTNKMRRKSTEMKWKGSSHPYLKTNKKKKQENVTDEGSSLNQEKHKVEKDQVFFFLNILCVLQLDTTSNYLECLLLKIRHSYGSIWAVV